MAQPDLQNSWLSVPTYSDFFVSSFATYGRKLKRSSSSMPTRSFKIPKFFIPSSVLCICSIEWKPYPEVFVRNSFLAVKLPLSSLGVGPSPNNSYLCGSMRPKVMHSSRGKDERAPLIARYCHTKSVQCSSGLVGYHLTRPRRLGVVHDDNPQVLDLYLAMQRPISDLILVCGHNLLLSPTESTIF